MAVNLRKKYRGNKKLTNRNRPYRYQLDFYHKGKRVREVISDVEFLPTDTKEVVKDKKNIIDKIKADLEIQLANQSNGIISRQLQKANFIPYFEELANKKSPNTKSTWDNTLKHIIDFQGKKLKFEDITESWLEKFTDYLLENVSQNSARTYLQKVSAALNEAVKKKFISDNPFKYISKPKKEEKEMVFLTKEEIQTVINTKFSNDEVKNAFLFGCYTGLRYVDIKKLKWSNIKNGQIQITQTKTKGTVYVPLNTNAEHILNQQKDNKDFIFKFSNHNGSVNRTLKKLFKLTDIDKDVTFHSGRHTFATLLISSGANVFTVSKLLGHKDIKSTLVYAKVVNEEKEKAVNSMPTFDF